MKILKAFTENAYRLYMVWGRSNMMVSEEERSDEKESGSTKPVHQGG